MTGKGYLEVQAVSWGIEVGVDDRAQDFGRSSVSSVVRGRGRSMASACVPDPRTFAWRCGCIADAGFGRYLMAASRGSCWRRSVDGTKVRAWAGRGSFKGAKKLARLERWARERVEQLRGSGSDAGASEGRRRAAQERGAEEVARRAGEASRTLEKLRAEQAKRAKTHKKEEEAKKTEVKASLSDPEARMMRFADGAVRAAYNIQLAVTPDTGIIVAAATTDRRNDTGLAVPVVEQIKDRLKILPQRLLADTHLPKDESCRWRHRSRSRSRHDPDPAPRFRQLMSVAQPVAQLLAPDAPQSREQTRTRARPSIAAAIWQMDGQRHPQDDRHMRVRSSQCHWFSSIALPLQSP